MGRSGGEQASYSSYSSWEQSACSMFGVAELTAHLIRVSQAAGFVGALKPPAEGAKGEELKERPQDAHEVGALITCTERRT